MRQTLERLKEQDRLVRADNRVLFNTGLINQWFKEIYVICEIDPENPNRLINAQPVLENDRVKRQAPHGHLLLQHHRRGL